MTEAMKLGYARPNSFKLWTPCQLRFFVRWSPSNEILEDVQIICIFNVCFLLSPKYSAPLSGVLPMRIVAVYPHVLQMSSASPQKHSADDKFRFESRECRTRLTETKSTLWTLRRQRRLTKQTHKHSRNRRCSMQMSLYYNTTSHNELNLFNRTRLICSTTGLWVDDDVFDGVTR